MCVSTLNCLQIEKKNNPENNRLMKDAMADKRKEKKLKLGMAEQRKNQLLVANEEEDKIIKKLEKQLKFKKSKSGALPKSFASDGLDCILSNNFYFSQFISIVLSSDFDYFFNITNRSFRSM